MFGQTKFGEQVHIYIDKKALSIANSVVRTKGIHPQA
jgi:hypothetical protein